ncbi:MAG: YIP1 family protein [Candidatus Eisenbacteria bacterium]
MNGKNGDRIERPPGESLWTDVRTLWFSPAGLFRSLAERPRSRGALVLLLAVVLLSTVLTLQVLLDTMEERGAEEIRARGGGAESLDLLRHPAVRAGLVLMAPIALLAFLIASAGAAFLLLSVTGGAEVDETFARLFRVATWAKLVEIPRMLLWVPIVLAKGSAEVSFGPAAFFSRDPESPLLAVLTSLDLFSVWFLALYILGARIVLRVSGRRAAAAVLVPWALWQVIKVAASSV